MRVDFDVVKDSPGFKWKYVVSGRFRDNGSYDKQFAIAGNTLSSLLEEAGAKTTVMLCLDDPSDTTEINKLFKELGA